MAGRARARRMGRPPLDEVAEGERRQHIVEAAFRLFAHRGYAAVSLDDIAGEVGVTKAALYHHFSSKEELYAEMLCATLDAIAAAIRRVVDLPLPTQRKIARLTEIAVLEVEADADLDAMLRDVAEHLGPAQRERIAASHRALDGAYEALMRAGIEQGELRPIGPRILGHALQHLLAGFAGRAGSQAGFQGRPETVAAVLDLFLHGAASFHPPQPAGHDDGEPRARAPG
jgi:AcrR family transcriptional regulator